jgi:hypothetical protein
MVDLPAAHPVLAVPPAAPGRALEHFSALLALETDCWDVHACLRRDDPGFVLLDGRWPGTRRTPSSSSTAPARTATGRTGRPCGWPGSAGR